MLKLFIIVVGHLIFLQMETSRTRCIISTWTFIWIIVCKHTSGCLHHVREWTSTSSCTVRMRPHKARVQYSSRVTADMKPLSSVLGFIEGIAPFPTRWFMASVSWCHGAWSMCLWDARVSYLVRGITPGSSRLYLSVWGLQQSLEIPNSAFFSLFIFILWHPHGDSQPWHQVVQRSPNTWGAAPGISPKDPFSPTQGKTRQVQSARPVADWFPMLWGMCSSTF